GARRQPRRSRHRFVPEPPRFAVKCARGQGLLFALVILGVVSASCASPRTPTGEPAGNCESPADITFHVEPALALVGVGITIPELRIEGEIRYARITARMESDEGTTLGRM